MTRKPDLESLVRAHIPDHLVGSVQTWCDAIAAGEYEAARLIAYEDLPGLVLMLQHVTPTDADAPPPSAPSTEVH
jgi:hypothetical protein